MPPCNHNWYPSHETDEATIEQCRRCGCCQVRPKLENGPNGPTRPRSIEFECDGETHSAEKMIGGPYHYDGDWFWVEVDAKLQVSRSIPSHPDDMSRREAMRHVRRYCRALKAATRNALS